MLINEQAVINALLNDWTYASALCEEQGLQARHFKELGWLYRELYAANNAIDNPDIIGIIGWLRKNHYESHHIENLKEVAKVQATNVESHVKILMDEHIGRELIGAFDQYTGEIQNVASSKIREVIDKALTNFLTITNPYRHARKFNEIMGSIINIWHKVDEGEQLFIPSRFNKINEAGCAFPRGVITMIASRDGVGKSFMVGNEVLDKGLRGIPTAYYPFEDGEDLAVGRMLCHHTKQEPSVLLTGKATKKDLDRLDEAKRELEGMELPIMVNSRHMTISELCASITRSVLINKTQFVVIDGWKDILKEHNAWDENTEDLWKFNKLSDLAERYNLAIIIIMHVTKVDKKIELSEELIRGNGLCAAGARVKWLLQDFVSHDGWEEDQKEPGEMRLDVVKASHGRQKVKVRIKIVFEEATVYELPDLKPQEEAFGDMDVPF